MSLATKVHDWATMEKILRDSKRNEPGLLMGNGASQAIWRKFRYDSLYRIACSPDRAHPIGSVERQLFEKMGTTNFEAVLSALATAHMVSEVLSDQDDLFLASYNRIRLALIESVKEIHVPYACVNDTIKFLICDHLRQYKWVYTTNYDLLPYWCYMNDANYFKDYLWNGGFDIGDCELWERSTTKVVYLHGALHLYKDIQGKTTKKEWTDGKNLLEQFDTTGTLVPLFISEGTWQDKMASIRRNDYLSFAFRTFLEHPGELVVFGHSLNRDYDQHIINALNTIKARDPKYDSEPRKLMVSIYVGSKYAREIENEITEMRHALADWGRDLLFFDSTTHPLGKPEMNVDGGNTMST